MIEKFYEEELRFLYESGKEFAKAHPERARYLNIDSVGDRDPYVERLFEGFAFLTARIREKLDDMFPQLSEGILQLLWPQFLLEIPSLAIVEFKPRPGLLQGSKLLPRGSEILSNPCGPDATTCRFLTTTDINIHPLVLDKVLKNSDPKNLQTLEFRFSLEQGASWEACTISHIRIYLHAEFPTALMLYEMLSHEALAITIQYNSDHEPIQLDARTCIVCNGFEPQTSLLPQNQRSFWGYTLLREYFCFSEKFMFIDLGGFDRIPLVEQEIEHITYSISFSKEFPHDKPFQTENFKLYCSPVVNLFLTETEPVRINSLATEYLVTPNPENLSYTGIHSIQSITGINRITGERQEYSNLYTFKHISQKKAKTYTTRFESISSQKRQIYLILSTETLNENNSVDEENLSINAWCTNLNIAREHIREGDICRPGKGFPDYVKITNITRPTLPILPPDSKEYLWIFLSQLSTTWASLASADTLKAFLKIYDHSLQQLQARKINAILDVHSDAVENILNGFPVRGVLIQIELKESEFKDTGDIFLFGQILSRFLSQFISINSFLELHIILKPSDKKLRWNSLEGKRCLI